MVLGGQIEEVARYCETDVLNTYRVWLVYELFRGAITSEQLDWSERQIREFVANRKFTNIHLLAALGIVVEEPTVQTDVTALSGTAASLNSGLAEGQNHFRCPPFAMQPMSVYSFRKHFSSKEVFRWLGMTD